MANLFAGNEIVEMGIQIEKNGTDFYMTLAGQSREKTAKEVFKYLAGEEEKHITVFQKILEKTTVYEPPEAYPGEYFAYMNALASSYVFTRKDEGKEIAKKIKTDKEAIEFGIGFEKDSILFYEGMKKVMFENNYSVINELIMQEQNHLTQLYDLKEKL